MGTTAGAMTARITKEFRLAPHEDVLRGLEWYQEAHRIAEHGGEAAGVTLEQASAALAALSPQLSWALNVRAFWALVKGKEIGGVLGANVAKARRIFDGEPIREVIGDGSSKSGHKVRSFYRCILTAGRDPYEVCVDRHAFALAMGTRDVPSLTAKRYNETKAAFQRATGILNREAPFDLRPSLTPSAVQAVTWITWRKRFWAEGAFDPQGPKGE